MLNVLFILNNVKIQKIIQELAFRLFYRLFTTQLVINRFILVIPQSLLSRFEKSPTHRNDISLKTT